jgi:hypothetical protein
MPAKSLFSNEMVQVTSPWVTPEDAAYGVFQKTPMLAGLHGEVKAAHDGVFVLQKRTEDPRIQRLSEQAAALDAKHDDQARAIHGALSMLAMVAKSPDNFLRLRDLVLPDGLLHTQRTYRGEAGHAAMMASRLDDTVKAELKAITVHDVNMLDMVQSWLATGKELGEVEETRVRLVGTGTGSGAEANQARLRWIRMVNAVQAVADLANLDEESDGILFSALRAAERTADNRGRGSAATGPSAGTSTAPAASGPANLSPGNGLTAS